MSQTAEKTECMGRRKQMSRESIKYIAMVTMFLNHMATIFMKPGTIAYEVLVNIGYFTAVTMCYFLVEGFRYTRSVKAYRNRILLFAVISQIPFSLAFPEHKMVLNMMFTLYLCSWIVEVMETVVEPGTRGIMVLVLILLTMFGDWPVLAGMFTVFFVVAGEDEKRKKLAYLASALLLGLSTFTSNLSVYGRKLALFSGAASVLAVLASGVCILYWYSGKRAEKGRTFSKWFFYAFYPAHLLVLALIRILCYS